MLERLLAAAIKASLSAPGTPALFKQLAMKVMTPFTVDHNHG
ncbi:MAG: hypothetical protein AAF282_19960 [Cyanobacteria bacterium P01_A01_bin.15]